MSARKRCVFEWLRQVCMCVCVQACVCMKERENTEAEVGIKKDLSGVILQICLPRNKRKKVI